MNVCVVGTGYVGLVSGVCLAAKSHNVTCVDIDLEIVDKLNSGVPTIYEKGLPDLLKEVLHQGNFSATYILENALEKADLVIVAVGTPSENGDINLKYIEEVCKEIGRYIRSASRHISVIIKSTVIPSTTDTFVREILEEFSGKKLGDFGLGMNPEFLREGEAIDDFMHPDRIVLGYETQRTLNDLEALYFPWAVDKVRVNTRTAELIKYANNALLATQISAINEVANYAATLGGVDVMDVVAGVHLDKRWNPIINGKRVNPQILSYLIPGCGFGGSCFPKDVQALRSQGKSLGNKMRMMNAVLEVNELQPHQVIKILENAFGQLTNQNVLLLGLAFKPGTDDVRESPAIKVVNDLAQRKIKIYAHDPIAMGNFKRAIDHESVNIEFVADWRPILDRTNIIIIITPWSEYSDLRSYSLEDKTVFDSRRLFFPKDINCKEYVSIGRRV
jgi:UDPglucose 6-dehydrogenase